MTSKCIQHCDQYVAKLLFELAGCSDECKIREAVFSTFNHLSVFFPEAYEHMLKVWEIKDENN